MKRLAPVVLFVSLAFAPVASAQGDPRVVEAQQHFESGERHFAEENYALALSEYQTSLDLMEAAQDPRGIAMVYNIGQANYELGRLQDALASYERYVAGTQPGAPNRDLAERRAAELRTRIEREGPGPEGGQTSGGGGGELVSPIGVIIAAVGGAAIITGAIIGGVALGDGDAATADCSNGVCPPGAEDDIRSAQTLANVADGLLFGGLAVAATGVILMFVLADGGDDASASAMCTPEGCAATVQGSF